MQFGRLKAMVLERDIDGHRVLGPHRRHHRKQGEREGGSCEPMIHDGRLFHAFILSRKRSARSLEFELKLQIAAISRKVREVQWARIVNGVAGKLSRKRRG